MTGADADADGPADRDVVAALRAAGCVFAEREAALLVAAAADEVELERLLVRRTAGVPLEHVLGWAELDGVRVGVTEGVFVPRRRTGLLVDLAARELAALQAVERAALVDLCCGSGAVGLAVATRLRRAVELHAVDVDPAAVRCARGNLAGHGTVHHGDLFDALPRQLVGRVDVAVASPPYVPTGALPLMPREARQHEPRTALDGGEDGLDVARRIVAAAPTWLSAGGALVVEVGERQAEPLAAAFRDRGLVDVRVVADARRGATAVVGRGGSRPGQRTGPVA